MQIPKQYPLAVAVALAMNVQCWSAGMSTGRYRTKIFPQQFMDKQFGLKHKAQIGEQIKAAGYPDTGNGIYSQKLSYKDWYNFNVLQRIHLNYVQNIHFATGATLAAGLYKPRIAAYIGLVYLFGRSLYSFFYQKEGGAWNKIRVVGAFLCILSVFGNTGLFATNFLQSFKK